jgi:hypothetical protein
MAPAAVDIGEPGWSVIQCKPCILSEHVRGYLRPCLGCSKWCRDSSIHFPSEYYHDGVQVDAYKAGAKERRSVTRTALIFAKYKDGQSD